MRWRGRASDMQVSRTHRERAHLNAASSIHHWTRSIHSMWRPTIFCMRRLQRWLEGDISMMTYSNRQNNFAVSTNYIIGFLMSELLRKNIIMNAMNASYSFVFLTIFVVDEWAGDTPSDGYDLKSELSLFATSLLLRNEHMASDFQNTMHSANWNELFEWGKHFLLFTLQLCSKFKKKNHFISAQEMEPSLNGSSDVDDEFGLFSTPGFRYKCTYSNCGLQFKRKDQLNSHEYVHTKRKKFTCTQANCDKSYVNNAHLQRHIRTVHLPNAGVVADKSDSSALSSETNAIQHCRRNHTRAKTVQYKCDFCSGEFHRKFHLRLHIVTHTGNYPYKCQQCDRGFIRLSYLKRHEKAHKSHHCDCCDAVFPKWSQLVAHKHKEHATVECKCTQCNRVFHSRRGLKYHQQVHVETDERTVYQCNFDQCPKFFFHRTNLLAHHKSKHGNRKFVCTFSGCERELSTKQKLDQHMQAMHLDGAKKIKTEDKVKVRATRKDKGVPKRSTAAKLLNLSAPKEIERAIIAGQGDTIYFDYDRNENDMGEDESPTFKECSGVNASQIMAWNDLPFARYEIKKYLWTKKSIFIFIPQ